MQIKYLAFNLSRSLKRLKLMNMFHNLYSSAVVRVHLTAATVIWRNIPFAFTAKQRPRIQQVNQLEGSANIRIFTDSKYFWMKTPMVLVLGYMVGYCCSASLTDFLCISLLHFVGKLRALGPQQPL